MTKPNQPGLYWFKTKWKVIELIDLTLDPHADVGRHREEYVMTKGTFVVPRLAPAFTKIPWPDMAEMAAIQALENPKCQVELILPPDADTGMTIKIMTDFMAANPDLYACAGVGTGMRNTGRLVMVIRYRQEPKKVRVRNNRENV